MKNKLKILTLVGTRPEIIKLSEVIKLLDIHTDHIVAHTGQNYDYELNEVFFKQLGLRKPDYFMEASVESPAATIADVIVKTDKLIDEIKPDAFLLYGDTNSCMGVIAAKKKKIPIFHMEAGNRCFDQRVPEEINRKIVDHLSDINLPLSEQARDYLIAEGIPHQRIIKTGSPMKEVLNANMKMIVANDILEKENLKQNNYFLMSIHREENVDSKDNFKELLESISAIEKAYNLPIIISTHPRTRKKLEDINHINSSKNIRFSKPYGFHEYNKLQMNALCVLSDSGTITEESSIFNIPAVMIRQAHERPEGMDEGTLIMSGLESSNILNSIEVVVNLVNKTNIVEDYDVDYVSQKVLKVILSYFHYVNREVWKKS